MKWINRNDSEANYEDRRGRGRGKRNVAVGGVGAIVIAVIALLLGQDPFQAVNMVNSVVPDQSTEVITDPSRVNENEELKVFTLGVFNSANDVWNEIFRTQLQQSYVKPTLSVSVKRQPTHIQAHLVLPDTKSRPFAKPKELEISEAIHEHQ